MAEPSPSFPPHASSLHLSPRLHHHQAALGLPPTGLPPSPSPPASTTPAAAASSGDASPCASPTSHRPPPLQPSSSLDLVLLPTAASPCTAPRRQQHHPAPHQPPRGHHLHLPTEQPNPFPPPFLSPPHICIYIYSCTPIFPCPETLSTPLRTHPRGPPMIPNIPYYPKMRFRRSGSGHVLRLGNRNPSVRGTCRNPSRTTRSANGGFSTLGTEAWTKRTTQKTLMRRPRRLRRQRTTPLPAGRHEYTDAGMRSLDDDRTTADGDQDSQSFPSSSVHSSASLY